MNLSILFFIVFIFFAAFVYFVYQSQREYREEDNNIVTVRINYLYLFSGISIFLVLIFTTIGIVFLSKKQYLFSAFFIIFAILFFIPFINCLNHFYKELKRKIYYDRLHNTLIVENRDEKIIINLTDEYAIKRIGFQKSSKYQTNLGKLEIFNEDKIFIFSDILSFPQDFHSKNSIQKTKTEKIFIWI